jgi:HTH-type transcriptional regulator / antitoxin HipB
VDSSVSEQKFKIIQEIKTSLAKQKLTVRKLADQTNMKHPQIIRVTSGENYNIETLLRILDTLGLEIIIREKSN